MGVHCWLPVGIRVVVRRWTDLALAARLESDPGRFEPPPLAMRCRGARCAGFTFGGGFVGLGAALIAAGTNAWWTERVGLYRFVR